MNETGFGRRGRKLGKNAKNTEGTQASERGKMGITDFDFTEMDGQSLGNSTMKVGDSKYLNELRFNNTNTSSFGNRTLNNLKERIQMKKNQPKKVHENFSKTTTDNFNMTLIKGFADT